MNKSDRIKKLIPGLIIFFVGVISMSFEIAGSRILGPYFGTSVFVWTGLIGVIMGSLSIGYWIGGKLSVFSSNLAILSYILIGSAVIVALSTFGNTYVIDRIVKYVPGLRLRSIISSLVLFGPAGILFGMALPYGVKLSVKNLDSTAATVGKLYALSTFGSIIGTFITGFFILPWIGFQNNLYSLSGILIALSLIHIFEKKLFTNLSLTVFGGLIVFFFWQNSQNTTLDYIDTDTMYNRVLVFETTDEETGRPVRMLRVNNENSSAMFTDEDDGLAFEVLKYYRLVEHFVPDFKSTLMIGGSGYAFPKDYLNRYPGAKIEVVEIDPGLTEIAKMYFNLPDNPDLSVVHEDGRTFLNRTNNKYDAVFMDAYKSMLTIPFQLTTKESIQKMYQSLNNGGAVFANIISSLEPRKNEFLLSQIATYQSVFPYVNLYAVQYPDPDEKQKAFFQNFMLVGIKSNEPPSQHSNDPELDKYLSHKMEVKATEKPLVFTDEYAPVEFFASKVIK